MNRNAVGERREVVTGSTTELRALDTIVLHIYYSTILSILTKFYGFLEHSISFDLFEQATKY